MKKTRLKKISAFIPASLLEKAQQVLDLNQTETLVEGLKEIIARNERMKAIKTLSPIRIDYDVDAVRQRRVMGPADGCR